MSVLMCTCYKPSLCLSLCINRHNMDVEEVMIDPTAKWVPVDKPTGNNDDDGKHWALPRTLGLCYIMSQSALC